MTREQVRELKQLRAREARLGKQIVRAGQQARRRCDRIDAECAAHHARLLRDLGAQQRAYCAPLRAEARALRTTTTRLLTGRAPENRELAAITKRIGILEGRMSS